MHDPNAAKLEQLGLSIAEAQIYLAILHHGPLAAAAISDETRIKRPSVYPVLCSLADKGLVEGGAGYGSKFAAIAPDEALPALVRREKQTIAERERIAEELAETLVPLAADAESALHDTVQVLRTPQVITERLDRLQLEATRQVDVIVKAPILNPRFGNPAQQKAQQRGVQFRCLYERAIVGDPKISPYLPHWIAAGEEARVYDGELPYKLMVLDSQIVVLTLVKRSGQSSALLVKHAPFAKSMNILFDSFWNEAEPLTATAAPTRSAGSPRKRKPNTPPATAAASDGETNNRAAHR
jgi:hypothetical protein